jgi:hypothetical protein
VDRNIRETSQALTIRKSAVVAVSLSIISKIVIFGFAGCAALFFRNQIASLLTANFLLPFVNLLL